MASGFEGYAPGGNPLDALKSLRWMTQIGQPPPQPGIVPLPPRQFRPQAPPPTINRMPGLGEQRPVPQEPPGFYQVPGGWDPSENIPGHMSYGGPKLDNPAALQGLANSGGGSPLLELQRQIGQMSSGGGAFRGGRDEATAAPFQDFVNSQLAPQRLQTDMANTAMSAQHPAVRALAATTAQQKAMPAMATAQGMTNAADITAQAGIQKAMLESATGQRQEAAEAIPAFTNLLESLFNREDFDWGELDPQVQQLIMQSLGGLAGVYNKAGF